MPTDAALLAGVPFFQYLDDNEREILSQRLDAVSIPAGQLVFQVNDPGETMFVIRRGCVEVFFKDDTGERIVLETVRRSLPELLAVIEAELGADR